ncbi:MAG: DAK2 domain-containing protein [Sphingomonadaceae bacterium]
MAEQDKVVSTLRISGSVLRQMLEVGTALLEENVELVNSLNVFPVPDGDTGTNMLLTMQSALEEMSKSGDAELGAVAHAAAHGSLMGARGNSGVILSQILRGMARHIDGKRQLDGADLAAALKEGANTAYRGIGKPVEGTILTVAREAADAALSASQEERSVEHVLRRAVEAAHVSLAGTPNLLHTLREAGVVDAGGQGYILLLEGALMFLTGERMPPPAAEAHKTAQGALSVVPSGEFGYCTELLLRGESLQVDELRRQLEAIGDSVLVVGEEDLVHIHVHTHHPGDVLNLASRFGTMDKIKVENMQIQHTAFVGGLTGSEPSRPVVSPEAVGVVAVAAGSGLARVFKDLGAASVVAGGQSMNPSIEELVHGAGASGCGKVILLPNNPNVVMTAQQAQALSHAEIRVIPTRTICEGIAAMVAFNPVSDLETNVAAMTGAIAAVQSIELTRAVRTTRVNGLQIEEGQAIGLLNGKLVHAGDSLADVVLKVLEMAEAGEREVVTVYYGEGVSIDEAESVATAIQQVWPALAVEVVDGGQPHYPYIISVE